ncbi:hypothetical protein DFQ01_14431 [Paenibacillus cellulosilyticus]|uniref:Uncharacterized protein n=1 Tax=Paenibacillus cellulosilyticus TaxID=375489 RepID=A0A2V2YDZ1_9BACL|nr:hypothetical protein [Paenibacillus cellulosilyticus]PWV90255.1 hypothetical protein DFQ01_14431 [Paenibacillus cellulosilyticus]QKS43413.1 hypothetical protein HUB94_02510 [Paenibacillus cellulosilyticus]
MHLNTKKCCDHVFDVADIKPPLLRQPEVFQTVDPNLYGGNAQRFTEATCPQCEKDYYLWLKQEGQSWRILTISPRGPRQIMPRGEA